MNHKSRPAKSNPESYTWLLSLKKVKMVLQPLTKNHIILWKKTISKNSNDLEKLHADFSEEWKEYLLGMWVFSANIYIRKLFWF